MLPFRNGRSRNSGAAAAIFVAGMVGLLAFAAEPNAKASKGSKGDKASKSKAAPPGMGGIPMPIGHEIKGLVLPDFDLQGHLRSRFESNTATRVDTDRIAFKGLKVTSFTPENAIDLQIDLPVSTFDMNTRVLESQERATITRSDFHISGDILKFNTIDRQGTLTGNVKMVITNRATLAGAKPK